MADLLTLADAKSFLEVTDNSSDEQLLSVIQAASSACCDYLDRDPVYDNRTETYNGANRAMIVTNQYPIVTVTAVLIDGVALDMNQIVWDERIVHRKSSIFPLGVKNITISYGAGLDKSPGAMTQAAKYTLKAMLDAAGVNMNATGQSIAGVLSESFWPDGAGAVPPQAKALLNRYARKFTF